VFNTWKTELSGMEELLIATPLIELSILYHLLSEWCGLLQANHWSQSQRVTQSLVQQLQPCHQPTPTECTCTFVDQLTTARVAPTVADVATGAWNWEPVLLPPLEAYSVTQNSVKNAAKCFILALKNPKISPCSDPFSGAEGTPFPRLSPSAPYIQILATTLPTTVA